MRCIAALLLLLCCPAALQAAVLQAQHDLQVYLEPEHQRLRGIDRITLQLQDAVSIDMQLAEDAEITRCALAGRELDMERRAAWMMLEPPEELRNGELVLELEYTARFDDPLPDDPANFDNPGFGVRGVIAPQGALLLAGSGWHPNLAAREERFKLRVTAPAGMYAVTAGKLLSMKEHQGQAVSTWEVARSLEQLPLTAGAYVRSQTEAVVNDARSVPVQTFFFPHNQNLSPRYLDAAAGYVAFYSALHGEYAFDKFAVVENFFPTGYGFPSFTLLGGRVLRLPFIPHTSLRHEVAHCWWGNGVLVNYAQGNWCEGLTTYVADHLAKEEQSGAAARAYRMRVLRDYALLVGEDPPMPLSRFISRTSPSSRAIGYGKAMFVFHMLRKMAGDAHFWDALRGLYRDKLFHKASWGDIFDVFVRQGGLTSTAAGCFLKQWVHETRVPRIWLEDVRLSNDATGWRVRGRIRQSSPPFCLRLPLVLETGGNDVEKVLMLNENSREFTLLSRERPQALQADPDVDLFRLLEPQEIPATVNSVKGSQSLQVVLAADQPESRRKTLRRLLMGLNHSGANILQEQDLDQQDAKTLAGQDLLFFGFPGKDFLRQLLPSLPEGINRGDDGLVLDFAPDVSQQADTLFLTLTRKPMQAGSVTALLLPRATASDQDVAAAVRKITHYGSYGCLAFRQGQNLLKHRWNPASSPLRVTFPEQAAKSSGN